jgi:hypothetical protein
MIRKGSRVVAGFLHMYELFPRSPSAPKTGAHLHFCAGSIQSGDNREIHAENIYSGPYPAL